MRPNDDVIVRVLVHGIQFITTSQNKRNRRKGDGKPGNEQPRYGFVPNNLQSS